jgi:hypothetical protein
LSTTFGGEPLTHFWDASGRRERKTGRMSLMILVVLFLGLTLLGLTFAFD